MTYDYDHYFACHPSTCCVYQLPGTKHGEKSRNVFINEGNSLSFVYPACYYLYKYPVLPVVLVLIFTWLQGNTFYFLFVSHMTV